MLGKLARWLRMLGHDVKYSTELNDCKLVAVAKKEKRVLLTRDLELYQQAIAKGIDSFYLEGETEEERLAELAKRFSIELAIDMAKSRCPKCNARVRPIAKEEVEKRVERNTFEHYGDFWECRKCGQIYWQGAHWVKIGKTLSSARKKIDRLNKEREKVKVF